MFFTKRPSFSVKYLNIEKKPIILLYQGKHPEVIKNPHCFFLQRRTKKSIGSWTSCDNSNESMKYDI